MGDVTPVMGRGVWPEMTDEMRAALTRDLDEAIVQLTSSAGYLARYPGGGAPAHRAREAASFAAEARAWLHAS